MAAKEVLLKQKPHVMAYDSWPKRLVEEKAFTGKGKELRNKIWEDLKK